MNRFIIVPLRLGDDLALARYTFHATHGRPRATLVVDLTAPQPVADGLDALLAEFERTANGNGQDFAVLAPATWSAREGITRFEDLESCLRRLGLPSGRTFAIDLSLPARMEYLAPVRRFLSGVVRELHGEADAFHVEILIDELCLNAVENSPSDHNSYDVAFAVDGGELHVEVTNVFDDTLNSERIMHRRLQSFDDSGDYLGERGRGLFLVARIADGLQIRAVDPDRIRVSVTRKLGRESPPVPPERPATATPGS